MGNPSQIQSTLTRVLYLDLIRATAICLIILSHFNTHALEFKTFDTAIFWINSSVIDFSLQGSIGVSLFIILSGASLMLSTREGFDTKTFYKKRFLHIYPLLWVSYAASFSGLLLLHRPTPNAAPATFLLTVVGLDGFLVYAIPNFYLLGEWFLGFIIIMYAIFPAIRYLFLKRPLFTFLLCFCITMMTGQYYHGAMAITRFPPLRLAEFLFGMSFIYLFNSPRRTLILLFCGVSALLFYLSFFLPDPYGFLAPGVCLFVCLACMSQLLNAELLARTIRFVSEYSYGAFLIHHIFLTQALSIFKDLHLNYFNSYMLFALLLACIYGLSFLLTNATVFSVKKILAIRLLRPPDQ